MRLAKACVLNLATRES